MVDVYQVSAVLAAVGVLVGVVYYILDMRNQTRIRQIDLVLRLSSTLDSKEFAEAFTKIVSSNAKTADELRKECFPAELIMIGNFYERTGALLKRRLADPSLIADILAVSEIWEKIRPWVMDVRQKTNDPYLFESFEYLYNEMKKREQRQ